MENGKNSTTRDIKAFTLLYNGMFWLKEENGLYPILLYPEDLALLFQTEGAINSIDDEDLNLFYGRSYLFSKSTLIFENRRVGCEYYDEEQNAIGVMPCYVKRD